MSTGIDYFQVKHSQSDLSESQSPLTAASSSQPLARRYTFQSSPISTSKPPLWFIDGNPRPTKSRRHVPPPELPLDAPYPGYGAQPTPPYTATSEPLLQPSSAYFPTSLPIQAWITAPQASSALGKVTQTSITNPQHCVFVRDDFFKEGTHTQQSFAWNSA